MAPIGRNAMTNLEKPQMPQAESETPTVQPQRPQAEAPETETPPATVQKAGDWHLVTYGSWQISIAPDGLLSLPRHLHPQEFAEFVACGQVAVDVGNEIIAANIAKQTAPPTKMALPTRHAVVTAGPPPEGTTRMRINQHGSSIGRAKQRGGRSSP